MYKLHSSIIMLIIFFLVFLLNFLTEKKVSQNTFKHHTINGRH